MIPDNKVTIVYLLYFNEFIAILKICDNQLVVLHENFLDLVHSLKCSMICCGPLLQRRESSPTLRVALYKATSKKALKIRSGFCTQQATDISVTEQQAHH